HYDNPPPAARKRRRLIENDPRPGGVYRRVVAVGGPELTPFPFHDIEHVEGRRPNQDRRVHDAVGDGHSMWKSLGGRTPEPYIGRSVSPEHAIACRGVEHFDGDWGVGVLRRKHDE